MRAAGLLHRAFPQLRLVAVLRNPRERTVSAFNDYVRMGRIHTREATRGGLEELIGHAHTLTRTLTRTLTHTLTLNLTQSPSHTLTHTLTPTLTLALARHTVALVTSGNRSLEDFDVRILTSG